MHEWAYKPAGFVSYGGVSGGLRAVQMTKLTVTTLKMMPMFEGVVFPHFINFFDAHTGQFAPSEGHTKSAHVMLDELHKWCVALKTMRA